MKNRILPALAILAGLALVVAAFVRPLLAPKSYDFAAFGDLPVLHEGRVKPIDTVARWTLRHVSNRSTYAGKTATEWFLDMAARPAIASEYAVFRIDHPDIKSLLGVTDETKKYFTPQQISQANAKLAEQFSLAANVPTRERNLYQAKLGELSSKIARYSELSELHAIVPVLSQVDVDNAAQRRAPDAQSVAALTAILQAYRDQKPADFNAAVGAYRDRVNQGWAKAGRASAFEAYFHRVEPFLNAMSLYVLAFVLTCFSWLGLRKPLWQAALIILLLALLMQTFGLSARIWIHGRPPVTNLYASAIFIGWGAALMALFIELIHRNGIGIAAAAALGFANLIVAHNLDDGDNMEAVRAVLATNFWLSTHVIVVTLGYSASFLAGLVGAAYIFFANGVALRNRLLGARQSDLAKDFGRITYGIVCFATLLSFVGTVLGGIWADQSWGRFWGWDPKENGALLIVLWNAIILHARWGGLVRERGIAILAVFGNIVTSWSWFGVNMLGVGLHSYGFMDGGWAWLGGFMLSQLLIMALGVIPILAAAQDANTSGGSHAPGEPRAAGKSSASGEPRTNAAPL